MLANTKAGVTISRTIRARAKARFCKKLSLLMDKSYALSLIAISTGGFDGCNTGKVSLGTSCPA